MTGLDSVAGHLSQSRVAVPMSQGVEFDSAGPRDFDWNRRCCPFHVRCLPMSCWRGFSPGQGDRLRRLSCLGFLRLFREDFGVVNHDDFDWNPKWVDRGVPWPSGWRGFSRRPV